MNSKVRVTLTAPYPDICFADISPILWENLPNGKG